MMAGLYEFILHTHSLFLLERYIFQFLKFILDVRI